MSYGRRENIITHKEEKYSNLNIKKREREIPDVNISDILYIYIFLRRGFYGSLRSNDLDKGKYTKYTLGSEIGHNNLEKNKSNKGRGNSDVIMVFLSLFFLESDSLIFASQVSWLTESK